MHNALDTMGDTSLTATSYHAIQSLCLLSDDSSNHPFPQFHLRLMISVAASLAQSHCPALLRPKSGQTRNNIPAATCDSSTKSLHHIVFTLHRYALLHLVTQCNTTVLCDILLQSAMIQVLTAA